MIGCINQLLYERDGIVRSVEIRLPLKSGEINIDGSHETQYKTLRRGIKQIIPLYEIKVSVGIKGSEDRKFEKVLQTNPTALFRPSGKLVTQHTYANMRVNINITTLFIEAKVVCHVAKIITEDKYGERKNGRRSLNPQTSSQKLISMSTEDIVQA